MEIPKPSEADKEFFRSVLPDDPQVEVKPMFGNLGAFVHGNMFAGLFGPAERPMGGYVTIPADWTARKSKSWIVKAYTATAALPPKPPKKKAPKK